MEEQGIQHLVREAADGDAAAFARLVELHYMMVYKIAYKWCGRREDAEDVAQEVFVKLPEKLESYRGDAGFSTWLYRLTINATKDYCRKTVKTAHREVAFVEGFDAASSEPGAEEKLMAVQTYQVIHRLPEPIRDAVLLVFGEEMNHREAGKILGCAETTISWRIFQARKLLNAAGAYAG